MSLYGLARHLSHRPEISAILKRLSGERKASVNIPGPAGRSAFISSFITGSHRNVLVIVKSPDDAERTFRELKLFLGSEQAGKVVLFPAWDTIPYERQSPSRDLIGRRLEVLDRLSSGEKLIVVSSLKAAVLRTIPPKTFAGSSVKIKQGMKFERDKIVEALVSIGYERREIVGEIGEIAVRGSIIDIFPSTSQLPIRVDLLGEVIETIKTFDVRTQRSISEIKEFNILPPREAVLNDNALRRIKRAKIDREDKEKLLSRNYFDGIEFYLPVIYEGCPTLIDHVTESSLVITDDKAELEVAINQLFEEAQETKKDEIVLRDTAIRLEGDAYLSFDRLIANIKSRERLEISGLASQEEDKSLPIFSVSDLTLNWGAIVEAIGRSADKVSLVVSIQGHRVVELLAEKGIYAAYSEDLTLLPKSGVVVVKGELSEGFKFGEDLLVVSDAELFGERSQRGEFRAVPVEGVDRLLLVELKPGDFVVHENHGIGIYRGLNKLEIEGAEQEYILIEYQGTDRLYVPLSQMGLVQKYSSSEEIQPKINRLGGGEWKRTMKRAKKAVEDLTAELLDLYSTRESISGFVYPPDTPWQGELEGAFPYDETEDQRKAIEAVKCDMESSRPMDRLVCGDVGYGKTEVALRAAFKAAASGKQVAVLVPTTILAEQHYNNFKERFLPFPVSVEMLSRFRSKEDQKEIIEKLALGNVDVIIGTHRLLQKDIKFKDLGLVIIDEEQRFGVVHKEKLKKLRKSVDVITMTATPIPRTLYMALSGARDISMIATPPLDRTPIKTTVAEWSRQIVRESCLRELERGGQIYYVHNIVENIERAARDLRELLPGARIAVAHGQMREGLLEKTMLDFMKKSFDVLVCSTIIESGIDIPNVNTIIVDHASKFGLSQLYQLRGRVGRSSARAYAYILYRKGELLSGKSLERLKAISEFTALGSGYRLALKDLEIRGAGNILGRQQHGHMAAVGFDLYCDLIERAAANARGISEIYPQDIIIDVKVDAYIPSGFIFDERQRISYYRRMNLIGSPEELKALKDELKDRFGKAPRVVENLFKVIILKVKAKNAGIKKIEEKDRTFTIEFFEEKNEAILTKLLHGKAQWIRAHGKKVMFGMTVEAFERKFDALGSFAEEIQKRPFSPG